MPFDTIDQTDRSPAVSHHCILACSTTIVSCKDLALALLPKDIHYAKIQACRADDTTIHRSLGVIFFVVSILNHLEQSGS